ncbi:unnamed protein product [Didymodactylos carnosus]|uniref:NAD(P)(+)--arginine ADP-ribosyltransferase n=1 Tax=Didymodactylos carnosus TaxID=1234261 RepID=A0A8S2WWQ3_9BILA|nr:unnamed protein product [Didymodactylos carnosus]
MIEHCKKAIGTKKCWFGFTSTSKNRRKAQDFGNTLFIIDISFVSGLDISQYSNFPQEEEVLFPAGTKFQINHVEYDEQQNKHNIYIKLLAKNNILQQQLENIDSMTTLRIEKNDFDDIDIEILSQSIKDNQTVTTLDLYHNSTKQFSQISDNQAIALANALKVNQTLIHLGLARQQISDKGAQALGDALKLNQTLITLQLSFNQISDKGAERVADVLKVNRTLLTLSLCYNNIADKGAEQLADALKVNRTLITLGLSNNNISDKGAEALGDALKVNQTLITLQLGANPIYDKGAERVADALKANRTLTTLDLNNNQISDKGGEHLADALKVNRSLITLDLSFNNISDNGAERIYWYPFYLELCIVIVFAD